MQEFDFTIRDSLGIHARPAGQLVKAIKGFQSKVMITKGDKSVDATRLMSLMGLGVKCGDLVHVTVEGPDEDAAYTEIKAFLEANL